MPGARALVLAMVPAAMAANLRPTADQQQGGLAALPNFGEMTSGRFPRRLHRDDASSSDSDDSSSKSGSTRTTATPFGDASGDGGASAVESYKYLGCFRHDWSASSLVYAFHSRGMTVESCYNACSGWEYDGTAATHMGVEFGFVCVCGFGEEEEYTSSEMGRCDTQCAGDNSMVCGGYYTYDLYRLDDVSCGDDDKDEEDYVATDTPAPSGSPTSSPSMPVDDSTPAPVDETPVDESAPAPVATPAPVDDTPAPVDDTPAPVDDTPAPVDDTPAPVDDTPAPVDDTPAPVDATPAPVDDTPAPVDATPAPVDETPGSGSCSPNPCENSGSCAEDPAGGYVCNCADGFGGMTCQISTEGLATWSIILEFSGDGFTDSRRAVFRDAADKWATVIQFVTGGGAPGQTAGELVISAALNAIDGAGGILGSAGPTGVWMDAPGISFSGDMMFDSADIDMLEQDGTFEGVILHEMGHVIGVGTLWGSCSQCDSTGSARWFCDSATDVYNQLMGQDSNNVANIIETDFGQGTRCGHFSEEIFDDELMTGFVSSRSMPLSKLTCASLEDIGYVMDGGMADEYTIPSRRGASVRAVEDEFHFLLNEVEITEIDYMNEDGTIEKRQGKRFRF